MQLKVINPKFQSNMCLSFRVKCQNEQAAELQELQHMQASLMGTSCSTSVAGSDCSEELYPDINSSSNTLFPLDGHQSLTTNTILNMLDSNNVTGMKHYELKFAHLFLSAK